MMQKQMNLPQINSRTNQSRAKLPPLPPRLLAIARLVTPGSRIIDIGTDHGLLPVWLVASGCCPSGVASDLRAGPAQAARRTVDRYGLSGQISVTVADGLAGLPLQDHDTLVIAGLGGLEIIRILSSAPQLAGRLLLQPQKSLPELRSWLGSQGIAILQEELVLDRGRLYTIFLARPGAHPVTYDSLTAVVGPWLLEHRPPLFSDYLHRLEQSLAKASRGNPDRLPVLQQIRAIRQSIDSNSGSPYKSEASSHENNC